MSIGQTTDFDEICEQLKRSLRPDRSIEINPDIKQAAVALVLRNHGGLAEVLMIKRAANPRDFWSGHLALPGGRQEHGDANLHDTAVRETFEEIGINLAVGGEILGSLNTVAPVSQRTPTIAVTPFVAIAPLEFHSVEGETEIRNLILNNEVAATFWVPVSFLKTDGRSDIVSRIIEGHKYEWKAYPSIHGPIWGLTERILTQFLSLLD